MSRIYMSIDSSWSYNFLGGIKDELASRPNPMQFISEIYRMLADFVKNSHNFRLTNNPVLFNEVIQSIWSDLEMIGDIPVPYFQVSFRTLFNTHLASFNALGGHITFVTTIANDFGDLSGFVFEVT